MGGEGKEVGVGGYLRRHLGGGAEGGGVGRYLGGKGEEEEGGVRKRGGSSRRRRKELEVSRLEARIIENIINTLYT